MKRYDSKKERGGIGLEYSMFKVFEDHSNHKNELGQKKIKMENI